MTVRVRFHLDEHVPFGVAAGLRRRGIDVTCAAEIGLVAVRDQEQLSFAAESGRVLVTQDADFIRLHDGGIAHAGIAYCQQGKLTIGGILRRLLLIHDLMTAEEMQGRVEFL